MHDLIITYEISRDLINAYQLIFSYWKTNINAFYLPLPCPPCHSCNSCYMLVHLVHIVFH